MQTRMFLIAMSLLPVVYLTACQTGSNNFTETKMLRETIASQKKQIEKLEILENLLNSEATDSLIGDDEGEPIDWSYAKPCIDSLIPTMKRHGIIDTAIDCNTTVARSMKITESERFQGEKLSDWLFSTVQQYDPGGRGKNLYIKATFGIYTSGFLRDTSLRLPQQRINEKINRIGVFLVPCSKVTKQPLVTGHDKVYDLGGLQP